MRGMEVNLNRRGRRGPQRFFWAGVVIKRKGAPQAEQASAQRFFGLVVNLNRRGRRGPQRFESSLRLSASSAVSHTTHETRRAAA
jgi:hypothetical protein